MKPILDFLVNILKNEKKKIFMVFISFFAFLILTFPYGDLADVITVQVSKLTGNQVYFQFEDMGLSAFPGPSISFSKVQIDTPSLPTLNTASLSIAPSIAALLTFNMGATVRAKNFLKGDVYANYKTGTSKEDQEVYKLKLEVEELELGEIKKIVELPVKLNGSTYLNLELEIDPTFKSQPNGDFELKIRTLKVPASTIPTQFGPIDMPPLKFADISLKGRLVGGALVIENGTFGKKNDLLSGKVKGNISLKLLKAGSGVRPLWGAYDLKIMMDLKKRAPNQFALFLSLINDKYKSKTNSGFNYQFKLSGTRMGRPPKFSKMGRF